jgi:ATPase subunit of ABC transporter with duplicated ATPase domains
MHIPLSVILGVGSGLVTAIVFIFRLLTAAQDRRLEAAEKRNSTIMEHHEEFVRKAEDERKAAAQDRERYIAQLEKLVTTIAAERNVLQEQMIRTVASNTGWDKNGNLAILGGNQSDKVCVHVTTTGCSAAIGSKVEH